LSKRIYTRAGDKGETGLLSGRRLPKDDARVEAYGTVDELDATLGIAKAHASGRIADLIHSIQQTLFYVNAELAMDVKPEEEALKKLRRIAPEDIEFLETIADELSEEMPLLKNFVIPSGTKASSFLHLCRTVCRRAERRVITLGREVTLNEYLVKYLNRLSDVLFVFCRYENLQEGGGDEIISRQGTRVMTRKG
jgi:cob(I)alamin adenosyltransferase